MLNIAVRVYFSIGYQAIKIWVSRTNLFKELLLFFFFTMNYFLPLTNNISYRVRIIWKGVERFSRSLFFLSV